ncbi:MAG: ABC transporter permease [Defluviitaleaceae bacterium]|nr:ABC transporter permease [Defluviitaleaceae bacterium]
MSISIIKHYLFRSMSDKFGLIIQVIAPILIASVMTSIGHNSAEGYGHLVDGHDMIATGNFLVNMLIFQFMSAGYMSEYIHYDFKSDRRWRLLATPVSLNKYVFSALAACIVYALISGFAVLAFGYFVFNVYMGNIVIIVITLVLTAIFSQLMGMIIGLCTKTASASNALVQVVGWALLIFSGFFIGLNIGVITDFLGTYSPFSLAVDAIFYSGIFTNMDRINDAYRSLGILAGVTVVTAAAAWLVVRSRPV